MTMETHRHSSYRLTVADIGTEKSRTLVTCSLHELHCSTQNKGWTAEGSRELTKRAIVFPNRKKQLTGQAILLYSFLIKAAPMFSNNTPILSFLQSSNYSAQHAACIRNTNARVQCDTSILLLCQSRPTINLFSNLTI